MDWRFRIRVQASHIPCKPWTRRRQYLLHMCSLSRRKPWHRSWFKKLTRQIKTSCPSQQSIALDLRSRVYLSIQTLLRPMPDRVPLQHDNILSLSFSTLLHVPLSRPFSHLPISNDRLIHTPIQPRLILRRIRRTNRHRIISANANVSTPPSINRSTAAMGAVKGVAERMPCLPITVARSCWWTMTNWNA